MASVAAVAGGGSACGVVVGNGDDRRQTTVHHGEGSKLGFWARTVWYLVEGFERWFFELLCVWGSRGYQLHTCPRCPGLSSPAANSRYGTGNIPKVAFS